MSSPEFPRPSSHESASAPKLSERVIGGFEVWDDAHSRSRVYRKGSFELHISNEARDLMGEYGWKRVRSLIEADLADINEDFGETRSIDLEQARYRSVSALAPAIEELAGLPLAVKNHDAESVVAQYEKMRELEAAHGNLPEQWRKVIRPCRVYAAAAWSNEFDDVDQALFMERVENAKPLDSFILMLPEKREDGRTVTKALSAFKASDHPALAEMVFSSSPELAGQELLPWMALSKVLASYGFRVDDFHSRNVLVNSKNPTEYIVIDQGSVAL